MHSNKNGFLIYSNPITGYATIRTVVALKNASLFVSDIQGNTVIKEESLSGNSYSLSLDGRSPGTYIVKIFSGNNCVTSKFIVD